MNNAIAKWKGGRTERREQYVQKRVAGNQLLFCRHFIFREIRRISLDLYRRNRHPRGINCQSLELITTQRSNCASGSNPRLNGRTPE